jgi:hypothetical protein
MNEKCNTKGIETLNFYDSCLKKFSERHVKIKEGQIATQFCKFQEILFRNTVVIDEYYYQLK